MDGAGSRIPAPAGQHGARTVAPGGDRDLVNYRFIVPVRIAGQRVVDAPTDEDFRIPRSTCLITRIDARITITPPR